MKRGILCSMRFSHFAGSFRVWRCDGCGREHTRVKPLPHHPDHACFKASDGTVVTFNGESARDVRDAFACSYAAGVGMVDEYLTLRERESEWAADWGEREHAGPSAPNPWDLAERYEAEIGKLHEDAAATDDQVDAMRQAILSIAEPGGADNEIEPRADATVDTYRVVINHHSEQMRLLGVPRDLTNIRLAATAAGHRPDHLAHDLRLAVAAFNRRQRLASLLSMSPLGRF
jgi:hypothetical protein